ncbi:unnamed protein product, partial [Didymodactylos carnosus]
YRYVCIYEVRFEATKRAFRLNKNTYATFISRINEAKRQLKSDAERNRMMKYKDDGGGVGEYRDDNSDMNEQVGMALGQNGEEDDAMDDDCGSADGTETKNEVNDLDI